MLFLDEKTCIEFLEKRGYCIYKPFNIENVPKNCVELTKYFFSKVRVFYGIDYSSILWKAEIGYANTFVKQMSHDGSASDKLALFKCKTIIDMVFDNLDFFSVYYRFDSLKILSSNKGSWIIEKCLSLDENEINKRTGYTEKDWKALYVEYERAVYKKPNLEKIKSELVDMLGEKCG